MIQRVLQYQFLKILIFNILFSSFPTGQGIRLTDIASISSGFTVTIKNIQNIKAILILIILSFTIQKYNIQIYDLNFIY